MMGEMKWDYDSGIKTQACDTMRYLMLAAGNRLPSGKMKSGHSDPFFGF